MTTPFAPARILAVLACTLTASAWAQSAAAPPDHPLFGGAAIHDIWIQFPQADYWKQLTDNYKENSDDIPYIEASFWWNEIHFEKIGVRFKGNSSYNGSTTKKPFRLKLNEFVKGQKIGGAASYNLNNLWNDPSFIREKLYFDAAARAGLRAPRSNFARLYINGEFWGLYGLGEIVNSDFLDSRYEKADRGGNLYKGADVGAFLAYLGDDITAYGSKYEKKTNDTDPDWSDLTGLMKALQETPVADRLAVLEQNLDLPSVLTALALDNLTVNMDSYVGMAQNYFIYHRPSDGRFEWIPWDPSLAFGALSFGLSGNEMKNLPTEWSAASRAGSGAQNGGPQQAGPRPLATVLWSVPEILAQYRQIYQRLVDEVVRPDDILNDASYLQSVLRPHVEEDKNKLTTLAAFDQALTAALPGTSGAGGPQPGNPPPGINPPGGGPAGPGGSAPGIDTLVRARDAVVRQLLLGN